MANLNFTNLTAPNGALQELQELIFLKIQQDETINKIVNFLPNQEHGKKVGLVGQFGMLGKASQGCDPVYGNNLVPVSQQEWDIKEWEIAEQICYTDLIGTLTKHSMRRGIDIADLTGTEYIDDILNPLLLNAIKKLILRFVFFGDKNAEVYNSSTNTDGTLKAGMDAANFTLINGIFQRIFAGVTGNSISHVSVEANTKTTIALQKGFMHGTGVATGIMDELLEGAPIKLRQSEGKKVYMTQMFWDALCSDVRKNNKGSDMQYHQLWGGIKQSVYDGIDVLILPFWDEIIINALQNTTNVNAMQLPYRAVYTVTENLLAGTESKDSVNSIDYWFNKEKQKNFILAKDTIGAMVLDNELINTAY